MDAMNKLRKVFPEANDQTTLHFLGPSQRIKIGKTAIELKPYEVEEDKFIMAAFVPEINTIFMRFEALIQLNV